MIEGLFGLIVFGLALYAIIKTWMSSASALAKIAWTVAVILLPVIGFIAWLLFGPKGNEPSFEGAHGTSRS